MTLLDMSGTVEKTRPSQNIETALGLQERGKESKFVTAHRPVPASAHLVDRPHEANAHTLTHTLCDTQIPHDYNTSHAFWVSRHKCVLILSP